MFQHARLYVHMFKAPATINRDISHTQGDSGASFHVCVTRNDFQIHRPL
jgi:hypothetical protein